MAKINTLVKFLESQDYQKGFKTLMSCLSEKYGTELFDNCGIGKQLDIGKQSKKFFGEVRTADTSVDPNANVSDHSVISHTIEMAKPFHLINSYYRMWKELKKDVSEEYANRMVESQLTGRIYVNDFAGWSSSKPYSYYKKTVLVVKYRGELIYTTMEQLFEQFKDRVEVLPDRETIDLTGINIQILDDANQFVDLTRVLRHRAHCGLVKLETKNGFTTIVTEDHPVILEDGSTKQGADITLGDKLKISKSNFEFFKGSDEIDKLAYILGFTIGDGCITGGTNEDRNYQFQIVQKDLPNNQVYSFIKDVFGETTIHEKHEGIQFTEFGNRCLLCKYKNILKGAENKKLPKDILNWNRNEVLSLIAGLVDADGCVNPSNGVIDIRIASFTCVQQIAELLRWLGFERVRTSLIDKNGTSGYESRLHLYRVSFVCNDTNLAEYSYKMRANKELVFRDRQKDGRFETNEVMKILPFQEEYVYDITTATGQFHSQGLIQHNCYNYSTFDTALLGIPDAFDGRGGSVAPKNLMSFCGQIELFSLIAGNSTLGATGLADLLVTISIFVDKMLQTGEDAHFPLVDEQAIWQYTESLLTGLIYRFNQPYRGSQSLFVNLSIYDSNFLDGMLDGDAYQLEIDGVVYKAKKEVIQKLQVLYLDIMNREMERKPLTFPVTTACFSIDDNKDIIDHSFLNLISEKNLKFGFINIYCGKSSTLSSCCRLRSDKSGEWFSSLGSSSSKIGSLGVATGNLPHLAFTCIKETETRDEAREKFLLDVEELVRDCQCINNAKRNIIKRTIKTGTLPMYSLGYISLKTQYSTFGVIGLNEALEILGLDIKKKDGQDFALRMLNIINNTNDELQKVYKAPHNCEQIPGEGTACTLPVRDKLLGLNDKYDMYSNQFIPLVERVNMFDRIRMQGLFDKHFSGGAICHLNMDQDVQSAEVFKNLIIASAKEGVVYFAINLVLQECDNHHMTVGRRETCPVCGEPITGTYTRVVGFLSKVNNWVPTRREKDFPNRQFYKEVETK